MATREEALRLWGELLGQYQLRSILRRGKAGDGAGNVEVAGRPNWIWVRFEEEQNRLSMVRSFIGYPEDDTPLIIGKWHPEDDYEQVLGVYWGPYSMDATDYTGSMYTVPAHGETHHGTYGSDPAWIDYSNITFGRVGPTDPESLLVFVDSFIYSYGSEVQSFDGYGLDLTSELPGVAGYHCYVLVYFDPDTTSIGYTVGGSVPLAANPSVPALTDINAVPLGVVRLYNGQTQIVLEDIWQWKLMLGSVGGEPVTALKLAVVYEGDVVTEDGEIVWAT